MGNRHPDYISGKRIRLRPATVADKQAIYSALACSELTEILLDRPGSPLGPAITWDAFCADHKGHFFDDSAPLLGRAFIIEARGASVGQVYYNEIFGVPPRTEIDMWMFSEANCGHGYGSEALRCLCEHLSTNWGVEEFFIMPSRKNGRAVRAYEKAGFKYSQLTLRENESRYRSRDDSETLYMSLVISSEAR